MLNNTDYNNSEEISETNNQNNNENSQIRTDIIQR